jgi:hypothetical protein
MPGITGIEATRDQRSPAQCSSSARTTTRYVLGLLEAVRQDTCEGQGHGGAGDPRDHGRRDRTH